MNNQTSLSTDTNIQLVQRCKSQDPNFILQDSDTETTATCLLHLGTVLFTGSFLKEAEASNTPPFRDNTNSGNENLFFQ